MMKREVSTELDLSDHHALLDAMQETAKLRVELTNRWINEERLVGYLDTNRDGKIDYDEFYDELSQFGITEVIDVDKVFAFVDKTKKGYVSIPEMLAALRLRDGDVEETEGVQQEDDEDVEDFMAFPDTLLVALVAHNNMKVSRMSMEP
jgi:Ca2+-binding EF-hand superfamily protein